MLQHGAYTLLIDACYDREQFPTMADAIDWTWASSAAEVEAVEFVLRKFFVLEGGVYVQKRIQEEIDAYRAVADTNARIAREREANRLPKGTERARSVIEASPVQHEAPPNQEPLTINQEPKRESANAALTLSPAEKQSKAKTLTAYLADCKAAKAKPIPDDHSLRIWARDAGITDEMLQIAWLQFRERYTEAEKGLGKRYKDWPAHFATAVKANWFKLWFAGDSGMQWSSVGMTHKAVMDARMAQREVEHA